MTAAALTTAFTCGRSSLRVDPNVMKKNLYWSEYYKGTTSTTSVFMSATEDTPLTKTFESTWNLGGLKKEVSRLTVRCHKKIGKANQRLQKANDEVGRLTSDPNVSTEELEACPNIEGLEADLEELRERLTKLNQLEVSMQDIKGKKALLPEHVAELALELQVDDEPPTRKAKPTKKEKGPKNMEAFRLPYRRFYTNNKTEIRVRYRLVI
jgi:hypothetical protein